MGQIFCKAALLPAPSFLICEKFSLWKSRSKQWSPILSRLPVSHALTFSWSRHNPCALLVVSLAAAAAALAVLSLFEVCLLLVLDNFLIWPPHFTHLTLFLSNLCFSDSCRCLAGGLHVHFWVRLTVLCSLRPLCHHAVLHRVPLTQQCTIHNKGRDVFPGLHHCQWLFWMTSVNTTPVLQMLANCLWCFGSFFLCCLKWLRGGSMAYNSPSAGVSYFLTTKPLESPGKQSRTNFIRWLEAERLGEIIVVFFLLIILK